MTKSLSLVADRSVIDASGSMRGIFVDGLHYPGISAVRISGFTIKNANMEGILVLNATDVAVSGNTVSNNDKALTPSGCSVLPAYEPGEAMDCGEGIHFQAVDHSILTNNNVQSNAGGGVLLSDDTGATHHNLVSFNTVTDNPGACGITLASHIPPNTVTGNGVFKNTLYANRSLRNGRGGPSGGAGIGLFAGVVGGETFDNVVVDNLVEENGHPGVSMHAHAPGESLNDNLVVGNTIVNNGADTNDAHTPGPTGINIYSKSPSSGNMISGNMIQSESYDVVVSIANLVQVQFNNLLGLQVGLLNFGPGPVDATENFWSCGVGPTMVGSCSLVQGSSVTWMPPLQNPIPPQPNY